MSNSIGCGCCGYFADDYFGSTLDERRSSNSNTWGFSRKIGDHTFGDYHYKTGCSSSRTAHSNTWIVDDERRNKIRNGIRVLTKVLDIGGYIPGISIVAGLIRIIAASILGRNIEKNITNGTFCGELASETRRTYKAQIRRGVLEIIPVVGKIINLGLDCYWYNQWGTKPVGNLTEECRGNYHDSN